jgi:ABC-type multidrug transport system permease subunit
MSTINTMATPPGSKSSALWRNLKAIEIVWYREILRYVRDWVRFISSLMLPLVLLFVFGSGLAKSFNLAEGSPLAGTYGVSYQTFIFPGAISMAVLFTALSSASSIVWDREFGFLREMLVAPVSRTSLVAGQGSWWQHHRHGAGHHYVDLCTTDWGSARCGAGDNTDAGDAAAGV